eukprot:COSAG05_NODE_214_length_13907_cov_28.992178_21_plen_69_part_00
MVRGWPACRYTYIQAKEEELWQAIKENIHCVAKISQCCSVKSDMRDPTLQVPSPPVSILDAPSISMGH